MVPPTSESADSWRTEIDPLPDLVVLDLDFTIWDCGGSWVDCTAPPFVVSAGGLIRDQTGAVMRLYDHVPEILEFLLGRGVPLAVASRTHAPTEAEHLLELLGILPVFTHREIYPGSKRTHLQALQEKSGIPFDRMVFFDDEQRNIDEVAALGVESTFVRSGLTWPVLRRTLQSYAARR